MGNRRGAIGFLLMAITVLLLTSSCASRKKAVKPAPHADYQWMTAKMNGKLNTENGDIDFSGSIRMRRDSVVWLSASGFMGIENIRAMITQDSVFVLNRMDQTYLAEPLVEVADRYQWFPTLQENQALLLGDPVELRYGDNIVKIRYSDIHWDEPTSFPIKINKNYERIKL